MDRLTQGFFEDDASYARRLALDDWEQEIEQATGTRPTHGFLESEEDYVARIKTEVFALRVVGTLKKLADERIYRPANDFRNRLRQCRDKLTELHYLARRTDVELGFIYAEFSECALSYENLLSTALQSGINLSAYDNEQEEIRQLATYIEVDVRWKQYRESRSLQYKTPDWVSSLSRIAAAADDALTVIGLRPIAGNIYRIFLRILGLLTGREYGQLGPGSSIKYLPP